MTETLLSLISIFVGIIGANLIGFFSKKYSFGLIGNTIAGVFGSIFLVKIFAQLGIHPTIIIKEGTVNVILLILNLTVSVLGGIMALILIKKLKLKMNKKSKFSN